MAYKYCQHVRENGTFCGSGAVRGRAYCYFHLRTRAHRLAMAQAQSQQQPWRLELPPLEDMHAVQVALMQVANGLAQDLIEPRRAGLLLYCLQQAATNLSNPRAWIMGSPFKLSSSETARTVAEYPGLEPEFGLPPRINLDAPPYQLFSSQPPIGDMSEEQWSAYVQRKIDDEYAQRAAALKKPPQSDHPEKSLQAATTDNRQLTTAVQR
jgi:hypothetical protein